MRTAHEKTKQTRRIAEGKVYQAYISAQACCCTAAANRTQYNTGSLLLGIARRTGNILQITMRIKNTFVGIVFNKRQKDFADMDMSIGKLNGQTLLQGTECHLGSTIRNHTRKSIKPGPAGNKDNGAVRVNVRKGCSEQIHCCQ